MNENKGIPLRLDELGMARITCQTNWAVHFKLMDRYYVLKENEDSISLYLKPLNGGRGHWKIVVSSWGNLPTPRYYGKRMVYSQADVRSWMLELAGYGIVKIIDDKERPMHKDQLMKELPAEDLISLFHIRLLQNSPCKICKKKHLCPVAGFGLPVANCNQDIIRL